MVEFNLIGGATCLDFANTLAGVRGGATYEKLGDYCALVDWSRQAGILTRKTATRLRREAERRPDETAAVLARAKELREAVYRVFHAFIQGNPPNKGDLAMLNRELARAMGRAGITFRAESFHWDWSGQESALDRMLLPISRSAADLLVSAELDRVGECHADDCGWLFLDTSKNRRRSWCDMKWCGNRAKVRAHRKRRTGVKAAGR